MNTCANSPLQKEYATQFLQVRLSDLVDHPISESIEIQFKISNPLFLIIVMHLDILLLLDKVFNPPQLENVLVYLLLVSIRQQLVALFKMAELA